MRGCIAKPRPFPPDPAALRTAKKVLRDYRKERDRLQAYLWEIVEVYELRAFKERVLAKRLKFSNCNELAENMDAHYPLGFAMDRHAAPPDWTIVFDDAGRPQTWLHGLRNSMAEDYEKVKARYLSATSKLLEREGQMRDAVPIVVQDCMSRGQTPDVADGERALFFETREEIWREMGAGELV